MPLTERNQVYRSGLRSILFVLVFAFLFFPVRGAAEIGGRPEKSDFVISYTQASGVFAPLWVAHENGLFKKYGLGTALKLLNTQVATQSLIAGELDVISTGPNVVEVRLQGAPVKYIGASLQRYILQLWGAKGLNSLGDIKGKTIGVTTPKTVAEIATREALKKTGVISDKDVSFIYLQTVPAILTAVMSGKTSAGTLSAPNTLKARDAGLTLLLDIGQTSRGCISLGLRQRGSSSPIQTRFTLFSKRLRKPRSCRNRTLPSPKKLLANTPTPMMLGSSRIPMSSSRRIGMRASSCRSSRFRRT